MVSARGPSETSTSPPLTLTVVASVVAYVAPLSKPRRSLPFAITVDDGLARFDCTIYREVAAGDHTIVVGRVVGGDGRDGHPLVYFRGGYTALG